MADELMGVCISCRELAGWPILARASLAESKMP